jgi:hypothetical protein
MESSAVRSDLQLPEQSEEHKIRAERGDASRAKRETPVL